MRKKTSNAHFTFLYPGYPSDGDMPPKDAACIAIPNGGEFVSICGEKYYGEQPSAVFNSPQALRDLAQVLEEAADLFEQNRLNRRR